MESIIQFDKYLKDNLIDLESDDFTRELVKTYFQDEAMKTRWKSILTKEYNYNLNLKNDTSALNPKRKKKGIVVISSILAIAASMLLLWNVLPFTSVINNDPIEQLLSTHYAKPYTRELLKGPAIEENVREQAYNYYQNKQYAAAIPLLEKTIANNQEEDGDSFFLGLAYLYNSNPEKSIAPFKSILNQPITGYRDMATWYLALALTDAKNYEEARIYLNLVSQWKGNAGKLKLANDAQKILETIIDK